MLRYLFAFIVLMHGLIHFMGYAKAFNYGNITQLSKVISKPAGFMWFLTAFLFITATVMYLLKRDAWPVLAIVAALISQVLIITVWKDAKFGSIANLMVLLIAIPAFAAVRFDNRVKKEVTAIFSSTQKTNSIVTNEMIGGLPPVVQQWIKNSGMIGKDKIQTARLKQKGEMLTKSGGKWMPFTATQYFNIDEPAFNWQAEIKMMSFITLNARDKFENGKGEMLVKILSLFNVVKAGGNIPMNESTMLRYLAETCWFPSAALNSYIKWEMVDSTSAKATMNYKGLNVSGIFRFTDHSDVISFEGKRFYKNGKHESMETWFIENTEHKEFNGIRIPSKSKVIWKLATGDFHWLSIDIINMEINQVKMFD